MSQILESDVTILIKNAERLQRELAEARRHYVRARPQRFETSKASSGSAGESQLLSVRQFAHAIGVTEACVRQWTLLWKIDVVKLSGRAGTNTPH